jgi:hypothetical protein
MLAFVLLLTAVFLAAVFGLDGENFLNIPSISIFLRSFWFSTFVFTPFFATLARAFGATGEAGSAASAGDAGASVVSSATATYYSGACYSTYSAGTAAYYSGTCYSTYSASAGTSISYSSTYTVLKSLFLKLDFLTSPDL